MRERTNSSVQSEEANEEYSKTAQTASNLLDVLKIKDRGLLKNFLKQLAQGKKLGEVSATSVRYDKLQDIIIGMCQGIEVVPASVLDPLLDFLKSQGDDNESAKKEAFFQVLSDTLDSGKVGAVSSSGNSISIGFRKNTVGSEVNVIQAYRIEDQGDKKGYRDTRYIIKRTDGREVARTPNEPQELREGDRVYLVYQELGRDIAIFDCDRQINILPTSVLYNDLIEIYRN